MQGEIRISPSEMEVRVSQYKTQGDAVQEVINKMDEYLGALQEEWRGEASAAYAEKYESLKPNFENMRDLIYDIADALQAVAKRMGEEDSKIASQFRNA